MRDQHGIEGLIGQLRAAVAELGKLRARGLNMIELRHRERLILRLQRHLAFAVRDVLSENRDSPLHSRRVGGDAR
jgi:hypothetical protein